MSESLHTRTRNLSLANLEWSNDVADISVEPISLIERETVAICERGERGVGESSQVSGEEVVDASRN